MSDRRRYASIGLIVLLMAAVVVMTGESFYERSSIAGVPELPQPEPREAAIAAQQGQFAALERPQLVPYPDAIEEKRTLASVYERRAYPGAPPLIPHEVNADMSAAGNGCLACHRDGGYSPKFEAYTPPTPHPHLVACQQCHVPQHETPLFVATVWQRPEAPAVDVVALVDAPPQMPHPLQMRENCTACHAGPSAPKEIRMTHEERPGCLQCHSQQQPAGEWTRPGGEVE